ncbi:hypothetical protein KBD49_06625 [Myxococcota bacterium]|nr:hypothetical protein [Myxococcota bacterium]
MRRRFLASGAILCLAALLGACESSSGETSDPGSIRPDVRDVPATPDEALTDEGPEAYTVPNPSGKGHGEPCQQDAECQFLRCIEAPTVTGGLFRICSKDCASGPFAPCSLEGTGYLCLRTSPSAGNDLVSFCGLLCEDADQCPPEYGDCRVVVGAQKTCAVPAP